jgi:hypothetical protein
MRPGDDKMSVTEGDTLFLSNLRRKRPIFQKKLDGPKRFFGSFWRHRRE